MDMGLAILAVASLGFIGLGAKPPAPEWGAMISVARSYMPDWWWYSFFPGLFIFLTVLGFNLFGDGLRDMLDPRSAAAEHGRPAARSATSDSSFSGYEGTAQVLNGIDLEVAEGESVGIVGETGCGKSVLARSVLRLNPSPPARVARRRIRFAGAGRVRHERRRTAAAARRRDRHGVPGPGDLPQSRFHHRQPDGRRAARPRPARPRRDPRPQRALLDRCACRMPRPCSRATRTNSPAACASAC